MEHSLSDGDHQYLPSLAKVILTYIFLHLYSDKFFQVNSVFLQFVQWWNLTIWCYRFLSAPVEIKEKYNGMWSKTDSTLLLRQPSTSLYKNLFLIGYNYLTFVKFVVFIMAWFLLHVGVFYGCAESFGTCSSIWQYQPMTEFCITCVTTQWLSSGTLLL